VTTTGPGRVNPFVVSPPFSRRLFPFLGGEGAVFSFPFPVHAPSGGRMTTKVGVKAIPQVDRVFFFFQEPPFLSPPAPIRSSETKSTPNLSFLPTWPPFPFVSRRAGQWRDDRERPLPFRPPSPPPRPEPAIGTDKGSAMLFPRFETFLLLRTRPGGVEREESPTFA